MSKRFSFIDDFKFDGNYPLGKPAIIIVAEKLKEAGMSDDEIDELMGQFLEEEAPKFVEAKEAGLID